MVQDRFAQVVARTLALGDMRDPIFSINALIWLDFFQPFLWPKT
ncbi:hypothetical protein N44_00515 [Microcystis aeruginosa NIES-44]|uniref:Uncharacterized protein n=1 Tax=Microcystis aeruginosa NIES-44 TaxID=449439 RepID=A0A0A1VQY7_MICAE|nr:hypothetical protein N44_00515 [Microcystis aeruginosa NIES-44]